MNIYLTESEYDAISFAWSQIATEIEASSDDSFTIEAGEAINQLSSIQDKYREAKRKSEIFYAVRAKFKERFPEASSSTLGKLARKAIKRSKNEDKINQTNEVRSGCSRNDKISTPMV